MEVAQSDLFWRKCSSCKKPMGLGSKYYVCSVSTCNGQRTGYVFCSMQCFEVHLPGARHRDAGAIAKTAPLRSEVVAETTPANSTAISSAVSPTVSSGVRRIVATPSSSTSRSSSASSSQIPRDILIVASKLKDYINARSGMNTSAAVMEVLSDIVRRECDNAIDQARREGRKTVLDRDFKEDESG